MNRTLFIVGILTIFGYSSIGLAQDSDGLQKLKKHNYYVKGNQAYREGDYIEALKYLFAFQALERDGINQFPDLKNRLQGAIEYAEYEVRTRVGGGVTTFQASHPGNDESPFPYTVIRKDGSAIPVEDLSTETEILDKQIEVLRLKNRNLKLILEKDEQKPPFELEEGK